MFLGEYIAKVFPRKYTTMVASRGKSGPAVGGTEYILADAISAPADIASEIVKFTSSIPRESCTNAKAKYSSSVVPPDPSVHFYHWSPGKKVCRRRVRIISPVPSRKYIPFRNLF